MKYKKIILILFFTVVLVVISDTASAVILESGIPGKDGYAPGVEAPDIKEYLELIYKFMIGLIGIAGFASLVWYGIVWIYSGISEKKSEALEGIKNTLIGIALALSSYAILYTINPNLLTLTIPTPPKNIITTQPMTHPQMVYSTREFGNWYYDYYSTLNGTIRNSLGYTGPTAELNCQKTVLAFQNTLYVNSTLPDKLIIVNPCYEYSGYR
ncbi:MAG: pilin [Patescibacteria group bacterium]